MIKGITAKGRYAYIVIHFCASVIEGTPGIMNPFEAGIVHMVTKQGSTVVNVEAPVKANTLRRFYNYPTKRTVY